MRPVAFPLTWLLASVAAPLAMAQTSNHAIAQQLTRVRLTLAQGTFCSSVLHAQRGPGGGLLAVKQRSSDLENPNTPQPKHTDDYHLTSADKQVVGMKLTAHGYSHRDRFLLLDDSASSDLANTVEVAFHPAEDGTPTSDTALGNFATVTSIDIISIAYANGKTWHQSAGHNCSVKPDAFVLVAGR